MQLPAEVINLRRTFPDWVYDAVEDTQTEIWWIPGGLGSGKTYGSALWHLVRCFQNAKVVKSWHIAPTHAKSKLISIPAFIQVFADWFDMLEGRDYKVTYTAPAEIYIKRTKQIIVFHSAMKWQSLVGENISHWSATECGYFSGREWFDRCQYRSRHPDSFCIQGLGEGTPEGTTNSFADLANFDGYDPVNQARRITLWTDDNTHLKPGYIEKLERTLSYDPGKLQSYRYGLFVPFQKGSAYWEFFYSRNVVLDVEASPQLPVLLCFDFNKSPLAWVAMQRQPVSKNYIRYHRYVALKETAGTARGLLDACAEFISMFPVRDYAQTPIEVFGDPSGFFGSHKSPGCDFDTIEQYLRQYYARVTVRAQRAAPGVESRLDRVNALMAYEQFVVAAWCRNLIRSLSETSLKDGDRGTIDKPSGEDWTHYSDAVGYPLFQLTKHDTLEAPNKKRIKGVNKIN
jgi:hypothetical protein